MVDTKGDADAKGDREERGLGKRLNMWQIDDVRVLHGSKSGKRQERKDVGRRSILVADFVIARWRELETSRH